MFRIIIRFTASRRITPIFRDFPGARDWPTIFTKYFYGKLDNIARGFQAPNIAESGSNGIHDGTPFYEIGDPNLKPENSLQADATLGINNEDVTTAKSTFL